MPKDRIVEEVRRARERYAARFNFDLDAIYRDLRRARNEASSKLCIVHLVAHARRTRRSSRRAIRPRAADRHSVRRAES